MNILKEFWYGNIEPAEYDISSSKEYKELLQLISRNEDKLLATMTDEQKELFEKFDNNWSEYASLAEKSIFVYAFRLGANIAIDMLSTDYRN